jgi:hypothetical protein
MHFGLSNESFNHLHPHVQYRLPNNYVTGIYHNSDRRESIYVGKETSYKGYDITYGLVHGYQRIDVAPMIKINYGNWFIAPAATEDDIGLVSGIEVKF